MISLDGGRTSNPNRDFPILGRLGRSAPVFVVTAAALSFAVSAHIHAQGGRGGRAPTLPATPKAEAGIDLTGYWVSVVTEDWRWRMVTPAKGDYASVPLSLEGRRVADAWDPAKDLASGNQCKSYGAAAIMRVPGRLHVTWQDDHTLKIETDAGMQVRLLHFDESRPPSGQPQRQGYSVAQWQRRGQSLAQARGASGSLREGVDRGAVIGQGGSEGSGGQGLGGSPALRGRSLKVITTHMRPGYLRKNGVPYGENAVLTEYFDRHAGKNGDEWFTVTTIVEDPKYLNQPFITSTHFKKEPNDSKWRPTPCTTT